MVHGVSLDVGAGEIVALLGRNGMGKTTFIRSIMGLTPPQIRSGYDFLARREIWSGLRPHDVAARKIAHRAAGPPAVSVADGDRASDHAEARTAKDGWTVDRVFEMFPRLAERRHHRGKQLSGRRAADAGGRPRADDRSGTDPDGRAVRRPGAGDGAASRGDHPRSASARACRSCWSSRISTARSPSPTGVYILETGQIVHQGIANELSQQTDLLFQRLGVQ